MFFVCCLITGLHCYFWEVNAFSYGIQILLLHSVSRSQFFLHSSFFKLQFFLHSVMWTFIIIICLILGLLIMGHVGYLRSTFILGIYSAVWGNFLTFILWSFLLTLFSVEFLLLRCWTSSVIFDIYFLFFRPPHAVCGILLITVLQPGTEPFPSALGAQSLNHWTAREVPMFDIYTHLSFSILIPLFYF